MKANENIGAQASAAAMPLRNRQKSTYVQALLGDAEYLARLVLVAAFRVHG
jgi:hypothetical protein